MCVSAGECASVGVSVSAKGEGSKEGRCMGGGGKGS